MGIPAVKICGISTPDTLEAAIAARATHIGLVFFPQSPRHVALATAAELGRQAAGRIQRVGLFVDAHDETIASAIAAAGLDVLQLHGRESPERAAHLRQHFGLPVWKALPVASPEDVARALAYVPAVDLCLFDARTPGDALPGGMGLVFDWTLVAGWRGGPWGLAGGLNPGNVAQALRISGAPLVDTSSGVEDTPGVKTTERITSFCKACGIGG